MSNEQNLEDSLPAASDPSVGGAARLPSPQPVPEASSGAAARGHGGSLRSKLVLSLAAMFFLFLTIDEIVRQKVVRPAFVSLERNAAIRDSERVLAAINAEVQHLHDLATERAARIRVIESYQGASEVRRGSDASDPSRETWSLVIRQDGSHQRIGDAAAPGDRGNEESHGDTLTDADSDRFLQSMVRLCRRGDDAQLGMIRVGQHAVFMFAAVPMETASGTDSFVLARKIDAEMIASLRRQTNVDFFLDANQKPAPDQKLDIWEVASSTFVEVQLSDPFGEDLATLLVDVPRDLTSRSGHTSAMARQSFILGASAALLLLLLLLQRIVIGPLTAIREYSDRVAMQGLQAEPMVVSRNDEIGELARAFERMMGRLGAAQIRLASASRAAGMNQVADTVIHNVGNVLTNVNSLMESATDRVTKLRVEPLGKLADRLMGSQAEIELHQAMPQYLYDLADSLEHDRKDLSDLLMTLNDNIRHIHDVIRDQRRHTTTETGRTRIKLGEVICEAIRCCQARLDRDKVRVEILDTIDEEVVSDRSLLLQIMINVIGNARQAMRDGDQTNRSLVIRSEQTHGRVQLSFRDSGCGMTDATLANIFEAHYTTREHGSGLGLHFCAITLKRLGGSIHASSDGPGTGSTFVIELPTTASDQAIQSVENEPLVATT